MSVKMVYFLRGLVGIAFFEGFLWLLDFMIWVGQDSKSKDYMPYFKGLWQIHLVFFAILVGAGLIYALCILFDAETLDKAERREQDKIQERADKKAMAS